MTQTKIETDVTAARHLHAAAHLWMDRNQRDVAEIRLDDLLNPTADDAIESIESYSVKRDDGRTGYYVRIEQESGLVTRIGLDTQIVTYHVPA